MDLGSKEIRGSGEIYCLRVVNAQRCDWRSLCRQVDTTCVDGARPCDESVNDFSHMVKEEVAIRRSVLSEPTSGCRGRGWIPPVSRAQLALPSETLAVNRLLDDYWHHHILTARKHAQDCERLFGFITIPIFDLPAEEDEGETRTSRLVTRSLGGSFRNAHCRRDKARTRPPARHSTGALNRPLSPTTGDPMEAPLRDARTDNTASRLLLRPEIEVATLSWSAWRPSSADDTNALSQGRFGSRADTVPRPIVFVRTIALQPSRG